MKKDGIEKYLNRYAEEEINHLPVVSRVWKYVVCIPACAELDSLPFTVHTLAHARGAEDALLVVVINARQTASMEVHQDNQALWSHLGCAQGPVAMVQKEGLDLLVIDRWSENRWLPEKQGVGLARKIAGDVALALISRGHVSGEWIRCTDADVAVPADYFESTQGVPSEASALISPFEHVPEGDANQQEAMRRYDAYLQAYVDGLEYAGSPYAFHTIGSLISVRARHYAMVRGIPKREAGEDFYLLNKLAKVGRVCTLDADPIRIQGRLSDRVPFGTGAALLYMSQALSNGEPTRHYDPRVFDGLRHWLIALDRFVEDPNVIRLQRQIEGVAHPIGSALFETLAEMGAFQAAEKASKQVQGEPLRRRLREWNDAFRTLKLIHGLRDRGINAH